MDTEAYRVRVIGPDRCITLVSEDTGARIETEYIRPVSLGDRFEFKRVKGQVISVERLTD